jgi:hypothetical protein
VTVLSLNLLWVNLVATGEGISGASQRSKTQSFAVDGRLTKSGNGRIRAVSVAGETAEFPYEYVVGTVATRDKLRLWQGQMLQVRDKRGQKWYGTFFGVEVTEYLQDNLCRISFTFQQLSYTEGG